MEVLQPACHDSVRSVDNGSSVAATPVACPTPPHGAQAASTSPLELEHALGFNGRCPRSVALHPTAVPGEVVYAVGQLVILTSLEDVHQQHLLRGHDAWVSCVVISSSGRYVASGQQASKAKGAQGYIVIWDYATKRAVCQLAGHAGGTIDVSFSPDERWLLSTGADGRTFLWEVSTGHQAGGIRDITDNEKAASVVWGTIDEPGTRRQSYNFYVTYNTGVRSCQWRFDIKTMQHRLHQDVFHVPGSGGKLGGFVRTYQCAALTGGLLVCGTASSDVVIFSTESLQYKTSFQVGGGGVKSIVSLPDSFSVLVGTGDGKLTKITGNLHNEREWSAIREVQLAGCVTHIDLSSDGTEALVMTAVGAMYRVLCADLTASLFMESHTGSVVDVAFPYDRSDSFATAATPSGVTYQPSAKQGTAAQVASGPSAASATSSLTTAERSLVKIWSLSDYSVISEISQAPGGGTPTRLAFSRVPNLLVTGWSTGAIHAHDVSSKEATLKWSLPSAHKGEVVCLTVTPQCIISAADGIVRVWTLSSRECVAVLQHHTRPVTAVLPDVTAPSLFHTCAMDKTIMTFDMAQRDGNPNSKAPKRLTYKSDPDGAGFTDIAQRGTGEREIVCTCEDGTVQYVDHFLGVTEHIVHFSFICISSTEMRFSTFQLLFHLNVP